MKLSDIVDATHGISPQSATVDDTITGASIDTRTIQPGHLFVALPGTRADGHDYVAQAFAHGAGAALVQRLCGDAPRDKQILVEDTEQALQDLAAWRRIQAGYKVIGITGSVGKTTAKEMLRHCLASQHDVYATQGNYNNHLGLPLTILNTPPSCEMLILEMGMNHAGEIALLSRIARPDIALITSIDAVHLEHFDNVAGIARAKAEIMEGMQPGSPVILPADNAYFALLRECATGHGLSIYSVGTADAATCRVEDATASIHGTYGRIVLHDTIYDVSMQAIGVHYAQHAAAVMMLASCLSCEMTQIIDALNDITEPPGRGNIIHLPWDDGMIAVIDETYNASPASMRAALTRARAIAGASRLIIALGDMLELGPQTDMFHAELADAVRAADCALICCVGAHILHLAQALRDEDNVHYFINHDAALRALHDTIRTGDIIMVKGSRGSHMELIIDGLREDATSS